jgi:hypothetical protein
MKRSAPLTRKTPLQPGKGLKPGKGFKPGKPMKRQARTCSQAKDALGLTPERRDAALRDLGCVACGLLGKRPMAAAKHHLLTTGRHGSGKRRGEAFTLALCDYHHQGAATVGTAFAQRCQAQGYGPSLADDAAAFRAVFGDDTRLLAIQDRQLAAWQSRTFGASA